MHAEQQFLALDIETDAFLGLVLDLFARIPLLRGEHPVVLGELLESPSTVAVGLYDFGTNRLAGLALASVDLTKGTAVASLHVDPRQNMRLLRHRLVEELLARPRLRDAEKLEIVAGPAPRPGRGPAGKRADVTGDSILRP
jgi:hypothetical protein